MYGPPLKAGTTGAGLGISLVRPSGDNLPTLLTGLNDPRVMSPLNPSWKETTLIAEQQRFARFKEQEDQIMWHIMASDRCIGAAWINDIDPAAKSGHYGVMITATDLWGQGIGTLVQRCVTDWALTKGPLDTLLVEVFDGNIGSLRASEKAGYVLVPALIRWDDQDVPGHQGSMTRAQWELLTQGEGQ